MPHDGSLNHFVPNLPANARIAAIGPEDSGSSVPSTASDATGPRIISTPVSSDTRFRDSYLRAMDRADALAHAREYLSVIGGGMDTIQIADPDAGETIGPENPLLDHMRYVFGRVRNTLQLDRVGPTPVSSTQRALAWARISRDPEEAAAFEQMRGGYPNFETAITAFIRSKGSQ